MSKTAVSCVAFVFMAALAFGADPLGTWKMTADGPDGNTYKFDLVIKNDDGKFAGTAGNADLGSIPLQDVAFKENHLTFRLFYEPVGMVSFKLKMDGNTLKGAFTTQEGDTGEVSGER